MWRSVIMVISLWHSHNHIMASRWSVLQHIICLIMSMAKHHSTKSYEDLPQLHQGLRYAPTYTGFHSFVWGLCIVAIFHWYVWINVSSEMNIFVLRVLNMRLLYEFLFCLLCWIYVWMFLLHIKFYKLGSTYAKLWCNIRILKHDLKFIQLLKIWLWQQITWYKVTDLVLSTEFNPLKMKYLVNNL